ncbi:LacI family DNA-binding transcriptional regulator [Anaerococcus hydrogenalis]|uniref:Transcriptional regulator, LacI family n=1 Tax=Anaerococcus hydrogenalis ACS-025-V-Sch4 TaxID=879306 RepID=F0H2I0_9FIRM|nr:LacI family DNA-binding transcriptional regulator [Anaerococcus hydrogenalis]EGC83309.1 transcriptional regulator, LacI family [Anaerococcus hydrogenalis ACS-025-V-Sch4]
MKRVTIKEIASLCGVSVSTVSRAINNNDEISEKTRKKILDTIKEVGYTPNQNARNLKITKTKTIAVLIKGITNPFFTPMLKVLEEEITKSGYTFALQKVEENSSEIDLAQKIVKTLKPEGIIFLGGYFINDRKKLKALSVPFTMTTIINQTLQIPSSACLGIDDFLQSKKLVEYLISLGHKKIALIGPRYDDESIGKLRLLGYKKALEENGIEFDEKLVFYSNKGLNPYSLEHGYEVGKKIVKENISCTAIYAISDTIAMGAIKAIDDFGKKVPEDYSLAGFDGLEINKYLLKPITTIVQPASEIAYKSVKELFKIIDKKEYEKISKFDAKLYIGKTTKKVRS